MTRLAAVLVAVVVAACASAAPAGARTVFRGIFDNCAVGASPSSQQAIIGDMAGRLHAQVIRFDLHWEQAEPDQAGSYNLEYLSSLLTLCGTARAAGLRVMIDVYGVPRWASDSSYWGTAPDYPPGYQKFYPIAPEHLIDWGNTARYLAGLFRGKVTWWECWNEPNIRESIYPQMTPSDTRFSARLYVKLLQYFYPAVHEADPTAKVLGGVTAPFGWNNKKYISPQRFAQALRAFHADRWWDGYSHHPYLPADNPMPGPLAPPLYPRQNVTLSNINVLLRLFPKDPFYLTEYGYPTKWSPMWGAGHVSEKTQARYLTTAYREAASHRQVKLLCWFLWKDLQIGSGTTMDSAYMGLRRPDGSRKPSWYAFSRLAQLR